MEYTKNKKFYMMTTKPVERLVVNLAIPSIIVMMVSGMYNIADTYFVSYLGTSPLAATGVSFPLMAFIQAVGYFFGHGGGTFISRALGMKNIDDAEKMAATSFFSAFAAGIIIAVLGSIFIVPLAKFLGSTITILPYACDYIRFILIGTPFMLSSFMINNLLRYQGSSALGMIGIVAGAIINIGLDPLFIFVFHFGISGAAISTMISQIASWMLLFVMGCTGKDNVRILPRNFSPSLSKYKDILRGGSPSFLRQAVASISVVLLNRAADPYGDAVIAAISIVNRVSIFAGSAIIGFGHGFQPVCGFNYGAKKYERVKKAFWFCIHFSTVPLLVIAALCFIFAPDIIDFFRDDDPVVAGIGILALQAQCLSLPFWGWIYMVGFMLQTIGKGIRASLVAASRQGLFLIPLIFLIVPPLGVLGIQICSPIANFLGFLLAMPIGIWTLRKDLGDKS